jgi:hypothetical protein
MAACIDAIIAASLRGTAHRPGADRRNSEPAEPPTRAEPPAHARGPDPRTRIGSSRAAGVEPAKGGQSR